MLRRIVLAAALVVALAGISGRAAAAGNVVCQPGEFYCSVQAETPGMSADGSRGSRGGDLAEPTSCRLVVTGAPMPCFSPRWGWWSDIDGCYYKKLEPQPPKSARQWETHYPDGAIYAASCYESTGTSGGWTWLPGPPPGYGGPSLTPAQLAVEAIERLPVRGPVIGSAPPADQGGLVGLGMWLWTERMASTWGPVRATASVPGLSVTAVAEAQKIVWDLGDGSSVTCAGPGTPYRRAYGGGPSPTCGYTYQDPSIGSPGDVYRVVATTSWRVRWAGGGDSGEATLTRSSELALVVDEIQVLRVG